jgi:hypothetical protein
VAGGELLKPTARKLNATPDGCASGRGPPRPRASFVNVRTFGRWDCINARQRERAKESRFANCTSLPTSRANR